MEESGKTIQEQNENDAVDTILLTKNTKPFKALSEQKPNMHLYVGVTKIHRLNPRFNIIHNKGRIFL